MNNEKLMRLSIREIRSIIRNELKKPTDDGVSTGPYDESLLDDSTLKYRSVYVPNDIKRSIKKWAVAMGLHSSK